jgi:hypothetical protein
MAAIQVMGTHLWDTRPIEHWVSVLGRQPISVESGKWEDVFDRHPEFFGKEIWERKRKEEGVEVFVYYLRWRRAGERTVDTLDLKELTSEEIRTLKTSGEYNEKKIARKALTPDQVGILLNAAIELQDRAFGFESRSRWWLPILISTVTALLGLLGVLIGAMLKG